MAQQQATVITQSLFRTSNTFTLGSYLHMSGSTSASLATGSGNLFVITETRFDAFNGKRLKDAKKKVTLKQVRNMWSASNQSYLNASASRAGAARLILDIKSKGGS